MIRQGKEAVAHYTGDSVEANVRILRTAIDSIVDCPVKVAPLDDAMVTRMGVWLRGEYTELAEVMIRLGESLQKRNVKYAFSFWLDMKRDSN